LKLKCLPLGGLNLFEGKIIVSLNADGMHGMIECGKN